MSSVTGSMIRLWSGGGFGGGEGDLTGIWFGGARELLGGLLAGYGGALHVFFEVIC
jgi:hypothetical protein